MKLLPQHYRFPIEIVGPALLLVGLSLLMVFSASIEVASASQQFGSNAFYFLTRHTAYVAIGAVAFYTVLRIPVDWWRRSAYPLFLVAIALLVLVLVPGVGHAVNGSQRWLPLLVVSFQPSELMKLAAIIYAADYTVRKSPYLDSFQKAFLPLLTVMFLVGSLLIFEPDFGALVVTSGIVFGVLFLGGLSLAQFAGLGSLLSLGFVGLIVSSPYRMARVTGFMDPWADPFGKGYQLSHSLMAYGRGELFGVGLGQSIEKDFYLPEAHTDFLMAIIGEELGFLGVLAVIAIFFYMLWQVYRVARTAFSLKKHFEGLVCMGVVLWLGIQAVINMGMTMGVLPTKGLTLPFISFGGSALIVNCIALALIAKIEMENQDDKIRDPSWVRRKSRKTEARKPATQHPSTP